ncbi:PleD family two-component system response regulator [Pedobacter sp. Leaf194]|uniref:response regulator n=1 Tax=Pedobacter sp. Leaf194 TaxID=1736297 RepID=UPI000702C16F|nr:response regulator [Pedobacter sp. Leaf194]KQS41925.1 hypothetical protein ASG14_05655 [Pedobacter sp. Leaf194]
MKTGINKNRQPCEVIETKAINNHCIITMGKKIFVLEDDEGIRDVIEILLTEELYEFYGFSTVKDFNKGDDKSADLYLLDIMLPDGNGIEVCNALKKQASTANIPVLMMSANSSKTHVELSCSSDGFIAKPFNISDLLSKVDLTLQGHIKL